MTEDQKRDLQQPKATEYASPAESGTIEDSCRDVLERLEIEAPEILEALPKEQRDKLVQIVTTQMVMRSHRGPLPPPEDIAL